MLVPMFVIPLGKVIDRRQLHPKNTSVPILDRLLGRVIDVREEQLVKALLAILVTLLGMVIDWREGVATGECVICDTRYTVRQRY